jgi:hypothetical protein
MCDYAGRSDHLRRHLSRHAAAFKETVPSGWHRVDDRNLYLQVTRRALPTGESFANDTYSCGVCFDCCKVLRYKTQTLKKYVSHICAERRERPDLQGVKPANRAPSEKETPAVDMSDIFNRCIDAVTKMRVSVERRDLKEKLRMMMRECQSDNIDEETGVTDWESVFVELVQAVSMEYIWTVPVTTTAAPSVTSSSPAPVTLAAPVPVTPAAPVPVTSAAPAPASKPYHARQTLAAPAGGRELR